MVATTGYSKNVQRWMDYFHGSHSPAELSGMLHDDVVFQSPVVHTPQAGKAITMMYLGAAGQTLANDTFRYVRVFDCGDKAVLEFECEMDGITVNGIDMIEWDADGLITGFKVMVRPLKGMQAVHGAMKAMLEQMKAGEG